MTLLGRILERAAALGAATEKALAMAEELLAPAGPIPRTAIKDLLRRALRNGSWRLLTREERALLLAASRARVRVYRAKPLVALLRRVWVRVEQATARGRAVVAALAHLASKGALSSTGPAVRMLHRLVAIGLQLLNHPLLGWEDRRANSYN